MTTEERQSLIEKILQRNKTIFKKSEQWTREMAEYFVDNYPSKDKDVNTIAKEMNDKFGLNVTGPALRTKASKIKLRKPQAFKVYKTENRKWMVDNFYKFRTTAEMIKEYKKVFNHNPDRGGFTRLCWDLGLKRTDGGMKDTQFKPRAVTGNKNTMWHEIGSEVVYQGFTWIKISDTLIDCSKFKSRKAQFDIYRSNWIQKQRYVWLKSHPGESIGDKEVVIFLDGDCNNFDPENLEKVSRRELLFLNMKHAIGEGEITKTYLSILRAKDAIKKLSE